MVQDMKKIKEGNKTEANEILLRAEVIKDDINTSISNIRDILYTQSCSMGIWSKI